MPRALYSGSFDPVTRGHIDIIERASRVFDDLEVVVGNNPAKKYVFTLEERVGFLRQAIVDPGIKVSHVENCLIADYAYQAGIPTIIKGVRGTQDYDYERMMHEVNITQQSGIDTHILLARRELSHVSSSAVKELCRYQGFTQEYVLPHVKEALERRLNRQVIVGLTGGIAAGKSHLSQSLVEVGKSIGIPVHDVDLDTIAHDILLTRDEPVYRQLRSDICREFGLRDLQRKVLGEIIFNDIGKLARLNGIMRVPLLTRLRAAMAGMRGLVLINTALLVEGDLLPLCNNNVIVVSSDRQVRLLRLKERGLSEQQIERRMASQFTTEEKLARIHQSMKEDRWGRCEEVDGSGPLDHDRLVQLVQVWNARQEGP
jgi:pantetheine-phosphate adenylyltransferase